MPDTYIIRAEIDATYKKPEMSAEDWFGAVSTTSPRAIRPLMRR